MKRITAIILALLMIFSAAACKSSSDKGDDKGGQPTTESQSQSQTESQTEIQTETQTEAPAPKDPIIGTWVLSSVAYNGTRMTMEEFKEFTGGDEDIYMDIYCDETGSISVDATEMTAHGTWEVSPDGYILTINGDGENFHLEDGQLVAESGDGTAMYFDKISDKYEKRDHTGGGTSDADDEVVGTWKSTQMITGGETKEETGIINEVRADGTFTYQIYGEVYEGTWTNDDGDYTFTVQGSPVSGVIEDGVLEMYNEYQSIYFEK